MISDFWLSVTKDGDCLITQDNTINKWTTRNTAYFSDYKDALEEIRKACEEFVLSNGKKKPKIPVGVTINGIKLPWKIAERSSIK